MSRLLQEKDTAYELLLSKYEQLRAEKKAEVSTLLESASETAEQSLRSSAAMVAHWKAECAAAHAATADVQRQLEAMQTRLAAQEEETQRALSESASRAKQIEDIQSKRQSSAQATTCAVQSKQARTPHGATFAHACASLSVVCFFRGARMSRSLTAVSVAESGLVAAQSASAQSAARESLLLQQAAAATEKQTQLDKIIDTYMVSDTDRPHVSLFAASQSAAQCSSPVLGPRLHSSHLAFVSSVYFLIFSC